MLPRVGVTALAAAWQTMQENAEKMVVKVLAGQAGSILSQARAAAWLPELPPKGNAPVSPYISEILEYLEVGSTTPSQTRPPSSVLINSPRPQQVLLTIQDHGRIDNACGVSPPALQRSSDFHQHPLCQIPCTRAPTSASGILMPQGVIDNTCCCLCRTPSAQVRA